MLNVVRCAECRCGERRYAECRGAFFVMLSIMLSAECLYAWCKYMNPANQV